MTEITLGSFAIKQLDDIEPKIAMLLWGPAGCGKTTLAGTAPGKILWINFDPRGTESLRAFPDYKEKFLILDLSGERHTITERFKTDDGLGLSKILDDSAGHGIETIVVDSLTAYSQTALESAIGKERGSTLEKPGWGAYGARNAFTLRLIQAVLRNAIRYNKHVIFITHEDAPVTNDEGLVLYITMQLGGKLPDQAALQLSEVWYMNDTGKERRIAVRPTRSRKPMKTRMFDATSNIEFVWKFDFNKADSNLHTLEHWYNEWKAHGKKLKVPT